MLFSVATIGKDGSVVFDPDDIPITTCGTTADVLFMEFKKWYVTRIFSGIDFPVIHGEDVNRQDVLDTLDKMFYGGDFNSDVVTSYSNGLSASYCIVYNVDIFDACFPKVLDFFKCCIGNREGDSGV